MTPGVELQRSVRPKIDRPLSVTGMTYASTAFTDSRIPWRRGRTGRILSPLRAGKRRRGPRTATSRSRGKSWSRSPAFFRTSGSRPLPPPPGGVIYDRPREGHSCRRPGGLRRRDPGHRCCMSRFRRECHKLVGVSVQYHPI